MGRPKRFTRNALDHGINEVTLSSWRYFHDFLQESLIDSDNYVFRGQKK